MKILLVQTSFLGDTVLSTPVIGALKRLFPQSELWMMTTPAAAALVRRDPLLAGVLEFDKRGAERGVAGMLRKAGAIRAMGFDRVYALHRSARTSLLLWLTRIPLRIGFGDCSLRWLYHRTVERDRSQHDVIRNLSIVGAEAGSETLPQSIRLFPPPRSELPAELLGKLERLGRYALLVPGSVWRTKRWQPGGYREVAKHCIASGLSVVLAGAPGEESVAREVGTGLPVLDLTGSIPLDAFLEVVRRAVVVVCNDSMALHVASGFAVPTVAVFCATSPAFGFGPWMNRSIVVERAELTCKPCAPHGGHRCPLGTEDCSRLVAPTEVISALDQLLREGAPIQ